MYMYIYSILWKGTVCSGFENAWSPSALPVCQMIHIFAEISPNCYQHFIVLKSSVIDHILHILMAFNRPDPPFPHGI